MARSNSGEGGRTIKILTDKQIDQILAACLNIEKLFSDVFNARADIKQIREVILNGEEIHLAILKEDTP